MWKKTVLIVLLSTICAHTAAQPAAEIHPDLIAPPDICSPQTFNFPIETVEREIPFEPPNYLQIHFRPDDLPEGRPFGHVRRERPVVIILPGNSYTSADFERMGKFLAREGFIVGVFARETSEDPGRVVAVIETVLSEFDLDQTSPVGLVGHSRGAAQAIATAVSNQAAQFSIRSVAALAPSVSPGEPTLSGRDVQAFALLYGSQDEDVTGVPGGDYRTEAFALYDNSGTEGSTTCQTPPCSFQPEPPLEKFLAYVHGLSHPGIAGREKCPKPGCLEDSDFLALQDEACLGRGYANALMHWTLRGDNRYRRVLTGDHVPASVRDMRTDAPDHKELPSGRPVTILRQVSPARRLVINNFENWDISQLFGATEPLKDRFSVIGPGDFDRHPSYFRNNTSALAFSWEETDSFQWIGFLTPSGAWNISTFSHIALRIGTLRADAPAIASPQSESQPILICLHSAPPTTRCIEIEDAIQPIDPHPPLGNPPTIRGHSAMQTVSAAIGGFTVSDAFNPSNVRAVILALPAGTFGTAVIDSIELWRD